jgi:hypothetical protein
MSTCNSKNFSGEERRKARRRGREGRREKRERQGEGRGNKLTIG